MKEKTYQILLNFLTFLGVEILESTSRRQDVRAIAYLFSPYMFFIRLIRYMPLYFAWFGVLPLKITYLKMHHYNSYIPESCHCVCFYSSVPAFDSFGPTRRSLYFRIVQNTLLLLITPTSLIHLPPMDAVQSAAAVVRGHGAPTSLPRGRVHKTGGNQPR